MSGRPEDDVITTGFEEQLEDLVFDPGTEQAREPPRSGEDEAPTRRGADPADASVPAARAAPDVSPRRPAEEVVLAAYGNLVCALEDLGAALRRGRPSSLQPLHRAVGALVALPDDTRAVELAVVARGPFRGSVEGRIAQVAALVVAMGKRAGLGRALLREAAVAAAGARLGEALEAGGSAPPGEEAAGRAVVDGLRRLLPVSGLGRAAALRAIVAADLSAAGPTTRRHPLSRLVAVAVEYERVGRPGPDGAGIRPDEAIERVRTTDSLDRSARLLLLLTLGPYPVGTRVKLSSGEVAVVVGPPPAPAALVLPPVLVVADALGNPGVGRRLDLVGAGLSIERVVSRSEADLGVGQFMFS